MTGSSAFHERQRGGKSGRFAPLEAIGIIGLGSMGGAMAERLLRGGLAVVGFDRDEEAVEQAAEAGATGASSIEELVESLDSPRCVWLMLPHGKPTRDTAEKLLPLLSPGDLAVDGGNSDYAETLRSAERFREARVEFADVGVSGGVRGLEDGYNLMVGGSEEAFRRLEPALGILAPPGGYAHVGPSGAGHFVKMVHNALEYVMLQGIGEAFECLSRSDFGVDVGKVARLWQNGAVVRSWLLELLGDAFDQEGSGLEDIRDRVEDSGMGRWTVRYAVENGIPVPTITQALLERFSSQQDEHFRRKVIAALRHQFGGHEARRR